MLPGHLAVAWPSAGEALHRAATTIREGRAGVMTAMR
jgi:hypothetical protein